MNFIKNIILDILFPRTCPICFKIIAERKCKICSKCREKIVHIKEPICKKCGKQLYNQEQEYCYDCTKKVHVYDRGYACFAYSGDIKASIYQYKYHNKREYADFYIEEMIKTRGNEIKKWNVDIIIPVPLHKKRKRKRGYNQSEIIARGIGAYLNVEVNTSYIMRVKHTRPLKELDNKERRKHLKGAFVVGKKKSEAKRVLLIDDIYTTGSTLNEIAELLKKAGVEKVYILTLCIGAGY